MSETVIEHNLRVSVKSAIMYEQLISMMLGKMGKHGEAQQAELRVEQLQALHALL